MLAALLLVALGQLRELGLLSMSAREILAATGAKKSRAYELAASLRARLDELVAPVGRPAASVDESVVAERTQTLLGIARSGMNYLLAHPGAAQRTTTRAHYSDGYRYFVVQQCEAHAELDVAAVADALALPVTTVRDWLRAAKTCVEQATTSAIDEDTNANTRVTPTAISSVSELRAQTVLAQWSSWRGAFGAFCEHLQRDHGIPFGRSSIASLLEAAGVRRPSKRRGRSPDEKALRGAFASFFPGAVWVGDGCEVTVELEGERLGFNLELLVDAHTGAFVGLDVRDHEDAAAVIQSFEEGVHTTAAPALALLLDNKPCNHAPAVHDATEGTLVIPATKARPQNKGHVEGAFGLFSQHAPPLCIEGDTTKARARALVELCARVFFGALNMRPRAGKHGQSRIDLYRTTEVTPQQVEQAKTALQARLDKQLAAQQTLRERQDPIKRAYLDGAFVRLELSDPTGNVQAALARYDLDDITNGVATFAGKQLAKTLPDGVDVRYLLGIVRNIAHEREGLAIAKTLWDERLAARDLVFDALITERDALAGDGDARLIGFVDRALKTERGLERHFWLDAVAEVVLGYPPTRRQAVFERAARRIHTSYRVPYGQRLSATRQLAASVLPLG